MFPESSAKPSLTGIQSPSVLCVDLDGTLIKNDLLWECVLSLLKSRPLWLFLIPYWLLFGKSNLKGELARRSDIAVAKLAYRPDVLDLLRTAREQGTRVVLVTASNQRLAERVADHLGLFDGVYGSDGTRNLKGTRKATFLRERFGDHGFEYAGDSRCDLQVWAVANAGYVVGSKRIANRAGRVTQVKKVFAAQGPSLMTWVRALRGHHWCKNLLLFLPLALAHKTQPASWLFTAIGFALFGICASGLYVLNDLLDLHSDREHPWKCARPFAAADISIPTGLLIAFVLLSASLTGGFILSVGFGYVLLVYAVLTMWYSLQLKKIILLDAFVLSSFYTVRIVAGALITSVPLSQWFLAFSLFFFLSLAMAKRYSELVYARELAESGNSGRGYVGADREVLMALGVGSSFSAAVIFSLYVHSQEVMALYRMPAPLLLLCPIVLYWLSRVWLKAHRGDLHEDPITFAMRDPVSYVVAAVSIAVIAASMVRLG